MPSSDSAALIAARFLKTNRYEESYEAFIIEAGLPQDAGTIGKGDLTLETLLEEKKTFDINVQFEKLGTNDDAAGWSDGAPSTSSPVEELPNKSNVLSVVGADAVVDGSRKAVLLVTSASRRLHVLNTPSCTVRHSTATLQDSPILSCTMLDETTMLSTAMSGQLIANDITGNIIDRRRDHNKYAVHVAVLEVATSTIIATAGWDNKVCIYRPSSEGRFHLGAPAALIELPTKPEAILLMKHPETSQPMLVLSRTDSNFLYFYAIDDEPYMLGKQNLAPHSNAWVVFTPSAFALCPTDSTLLAIGTNSLPHMKLLFVRLLVPPYTSTANAAPESTAVRRSLLDDTLVTETQASQARAALAIADREFAAIIIHCNTMAPQTPYSTPAIAWRPDGSGVFVNGDDGVIRGVEASTGKIMAKLRGHEEGSKVRCLWSGMVGEEEWLVSGGFDQQLIVWKP